MPTGHYERKKIPPIDRFQKKYLVSIAGCWEWQDWLRPDGYGKFWDGLRLVYVHRWSYEHFCGPIPADLTVDHLCRNRSCVNPDHLELVTFQENIRRREGDVGTFARNKTHCPAGHPYDAQNTYVYKGQRSCKTCRYLRNKSRYALHNSSKYDKIGVMKKEF